MIASYEVAYDVATGHLRVEANVREAPRGTFAVDDGSEGFVRDLEASRDGGSWVKAKPAGHAFVAEPCADGPCRIRYTFRLREAARFFDDVDVASVESDTDEAPPSTWLLVPSAGKASALVRFHVTASPGTTFVTGLRRAAPDTWEPRLDDLETSPYSAFGALRTYAIDTGGSTIQLALAPGTLALAPEAIVAWVERRARAVNSWFRGFPMPGALVFLVPARGRYIGMGRTLSGGGGTVLVRVGEGAQLAAYEDDWVLVHEMLHLTFPSVPRSFNWAEEGFATYAEPFVRARAGITTPEEAWRGLVEGLPNGLPAPGDRGLDHTPTWGRTYWGGALFFLLADVEIRKRTNNAMGLEHALRGMVAAGVTNATRWNLDDAFALGDKATGVPVLRELHDAMGSAPHPVDLTALLRSLGVSVVRGHTTFDDAAPLAPIRRALTTP